MIHDRVIALLSVAHPWKMTSKGKSTVMVKLENARVGEVRAYF